MIKSKMLMLLAVVGEDREARQRTLLGPVVLERGAHVVRRDEHRGVGGAQLVELGRDAIGWVLPGRAGTPPLSSDTPLEAVQTVRKRAGRSNEKTAKGAIVAK